MSEDIFAELDCRILALEYEKAQAMAAEIRKGLPKAARKEPAISYRNGGAVELRTAAQRPEIRTEGGRPTITGYACVFNSRSEDMGGWREVILPGTFTRSLREHPDIRALIEHDPKLIVARTTAGTLTVREDSKGLAVTIRPPDTTVGRDLVENLRTGLLNQMSFAFTIAENGARWSENHKLREVTEARLYEVSIVSSPAYPATSVSA